MGNPGASRADLYPCCTGASQYSSTSHKGSQASPGSLSVLVVLQPAKSEGTPGLGSPVCALTCSLPRVGVHLCALTFPLRPLPGAEIPNPSAFSSCPTPLCVYLSLWDGDRSCIEVLLPVSSSFSVKIIPHMDVFVGDDEPHIFPLCHLALSPGNISMVESRGLAWIGYVWVNQFEGSKIFS